MKTISITLLLLSALNLMLGQEVYKPGPNSWEYENIPKGKITKHSWESQIYPNTVRDYFVYVPAQYKPENPAALMVFQDGHAYVSKDGEFSVPTVFDNLISQGKMPVTIGLFINPGHDKNTPLPDSPWAVTNRTLEYDDVSDTYVRFLLGELIPELKKEYNISDDPKMKAIGGLSSGAICAFSAAWFRPDQFHKVLSHIGSFTDIRGGHNYPSMIRKTDKKDIKVFLQDGSNDLDLIYGNWWLANLQMKSAFEFKEYEHRFVGGTGGHDGQHGGAILPESLTWLWNDVVSERVNSGVYAAGTEEARTLFSGETMHLSDITFDVARINKSDGPKDLFNQQQEQILIVKDGELNISLAGKTETIGEKSVIFLLPGEKASISSKSAESHYYIMSYEAHEKTDLNRGKRDGGSFIIDFNKLDYNEHDRGGIRNYFHRSTAMCGYYEMHMTNLNAGIKSHEPHVHGATELVIITEGETEMEIGNEIYNAKKGDVYFLASNVPHAIKNTGNKQCQYFAFQWN